MFSTLLRRGSPTDLITRERPDVGSDRTSLEATPRARPDLLEEYAELSKSLGLENPHIDADLKIEKFKAFLRAKDWPVFALATVTAYMDKKAAEESEAKAGWHWRPLRLKDDIRDVRFGTAARHIARRNPTVAPVKVAASDYYHGPHLGTEELMTWTSSGQQMKATKEVKSSGEPYNKLVPIHALRKVAEIEKSFVDPVSFFICDYAPAPHIEHPDPFLMVVVNNARLNEGVGRFVIDFWDEPGFGLEQMLQPA